MPVCVSSSSFLKNFFIFLPALFGKSKNRVDLVMKGEIRPITRFRGCERR